MKTAVVHTKSSFNAYTKEQADGKFVVKPTVTVADPTATVTIQQLVDWGIITLATTP